MMRKLILGSLLVMTCLCKTGVEASYTEELRNKFIEKNIIAEFLLTECRIPEKGYYGEVGWIGSKDSSLVDDTVRKQRPNRPNGKTSTIVKYDEANIDTTADKVMNNLYSDYPRYVKRKYTYIQSGNKVCFKQDYPVYINDDYPEMGVDFYVFESDNNKLDDLRKAIKEAENPQYSLSPELQIYQSFMTFFSGEGKSKRIAHDLNIIENGKLYFLDRIEKKGRWINLGDIEYSKEAFKYFDGYFIGDFYKGGINEFNAIKNIIMSDDRTMKVEVVSSSKKRVDNIVCDVEKVKVKKITTYGRTIKTYAYAGPMGNDISEETVECDLYFHSGDLVYFGLPFYNNGSKWNDIGKHQEHPGALFKVEKLTAISENNIFEDINTYQLERIPLGW